MKRNILSEILLYQYRYIIGYIFFFIVLVGALTVSFTLPGQISPTEQSNAVTSATLSLTDPSSKDVVDLPYHLLQKASLFFFHITNLGIKLPSLVLAGFSAIGLLWLLRRWLLRDSIAIFTICIAVVLHQFLLTAQDGTPLIMMIFWLVFVLLFALKFTANNRSLTWSLLLSASLALSLYTPLSLYVVICMLAASVLHPHLRFVIRTIPKLNLALSALLALILLAPMFIVLNKNSLVLATLAGWPDVAVTAEIVRHNAKEIIRAYLFFWNPQLTQTGLTPIFGASSFVLIIFGILNLLRNHHSARSYTLLMTLPILALPSLFNINFLIILTVPLILLLGLGIETLLDEWYSLFPQNPYARITALVPMFILLVGIIIGNLSAYTNAYRYSPNLSQYYTNDLTISRQIVQKHPEATLLVSPQDQPFYNLLQRDYPILRVTSDSSDIAAKTVVTRNSVTSGQLGKLTEIAVDSYRDNSARFYVYQK